DVLVPSAVHQAARGRWGGGRPTPERGEEWTLLASRSPRPRPVGAGTSVHRAIPHADLAAGRLGGPSPTCGEP
ncbi:hypothetical protein ACWGSA_28315, partial [Streptomyces diastaticus]